MAIVINASALGISIEEIKKAIPGSINKVLIQGTSAAMYFPRSEHMGYVLTVEVEEINGWVCLIMPDETPKDVTTWLRILLKEQGIFSTSVPNGHYKSHCSASRSAMIDEMYRAKAKK